MGRATARSCSRSSRTRRASGVAGERAVGAQVAQRRRSLPEVLVEARQVVVRVRAVRIGRDRELVRVDRFRAPPQVLERHAQVERGGAVVGARLQRAAVVLGGARGLAGLVEQPPEVHVRLRVLRIQLQRALIRGARRRRVRLLEIAAALVHSICVQRGGPLARQRCDSPGQLRGAEVEEDLPVLGAPLARAVADHDPISFGADVHVAQRPSLGKLGAQLAQHRPDPPPGDARAQKALRGAEKHQILEAEPQLAARAARGVEEVQAHVRPQLPHREAEHPGDLARPVAGHRAEVRTAGLLAGRLGRPLRPGRAVGRLAVLADGLGRLLAAGRQRGLQSLHQIDDLRLRLLRRSKIDLLALDFALDLLLDPLLDVVLVLLGLEVVLGDLLDDLLRQLKLGGLHLALRQFHVGERPHFGGVPQLLHDQAAALDGPELHQVLLAARGVPGERGAAGGPHRLREQPISAVGPLLRCQVIRLVEIDRIDLLARDELADLDLLRRLLLQRLQLVGREGDVLVLPELVPLHHVVALDDHVLVARADVLLLQPALALGMEQVEGNRRLALRRREELDRDRDQAERDRPRTDGASGHGRDDNLLVFMPNFLDERPGRRFAVVRQTGSRPGYALHLETDGVLRSWAVPKGPSPDPADRRFAVEIEPGGGGEGEPWDCGRCTPVQDFPARIRDGKLLFELRGYKLRGAWTLVRTRGKEWLLIKETSDGHVRRRGTFPDAPVLPVSAGAAAVREGLQALGPPRGSVRASEVQPMLAEVDPRPFSDPRWLFELKYDGFRAIAGREQGRAAIHYRRGSEAARVYPDLASALRALPAEHVVLDGEIGVLDESGRPSFQRLQKRALLTAPRDLERAAQELPATLFCFDLLAFEDWDLRPLPLSERKR